MLSAVEYTQEYVDRDGDRIGLHLYPDTPGPAVVIWPAMGVPAGYYRRFALQLGASGLSVVVADLRGTGASTPVASRSSAYGYAELAADVGAVQEALKARLDGRKVLLLGHSLGGQICTMHLATHQPTDVAGLVLIASGLPYWRAYQGWHQPGILSFTQGLAATSALLRVWPGWNFGGRQARGVIRDWAYIARYGRFPRLDGIDVDAELSTVRTPVLAISVDNDRYTPPSTMDHLCGKLSAAPVERVHYPRSEAGAPLDHFTWVRAAEPLAARVAGFAARL
jgi:predicted alpha/beta hydrolase